MVLLLLVVVVVAPRGGRLAVERTGTLCGIWWWISHGGNFHHQPLPVEVVQQDVKLPIFADEEQEELGGCSYCVSPPSPLQMGTVREN